MLTAGLLLRPLRRVRGQVSGGTNSRRIVVISTQVPRARAGGGGGQGQLRAGRAAPQLPRGHREAGEGWRHVLHAVTCHLHVSSCYRSASPASSWTPRAAGTASSGASGSNMFASIHTASEM